MRYSITIEADIDIKEWIKMLNNEKIVKQIYDYRHEMVPVFGKIEQSALQGDEK